MIAFSPYLLAGINLCLVILLAADRWVHKVTGPTSLESQIKLLRESVEATQRTIESANERASKKASELTIYLDTRREAFDRVNERVASLEGEMRAMRNQRSDGSLIQERRHDERRHD